MELLEGRTAFLAGATFYELYENTWLWVSFCVVGCGGLFLQYHKYVLLFNHSFTHSFIYLEILYSLGVRLWVYNRDQKSQHLPWYNF